MGKLRIRHGDNEIELEGADSFIEKRLKDFYQRIQVQASSRPSPPRKEEIFDAASKRAGGKVPSPAEYYKLKKKPDGVSQVLVFGKYLEDYKGKTEFTRKDINALAKEAKVSKDIHSQYFTNAVKEGLLRSLSGGKYSITLSGEDAVSSMS